MTSTQRWKCKKQYLPLVLTYLLVIIKALYLVDNGKEGVQKQHNVGDVIYECPLEDYAYDVCWGKAQGKFGDYNCDSSEELVKSATLFIKDYSKDLKNVSFILWTG